MIVKNYEFKKIDLQFNKFFLLNGDNEGAKEDFIKSFLKEKYLNSEVYFENEILSNLENFYNSISTKSFFNNEKIIIIKKSTNKIFNLIEEILEKKFVDLILILNADLLDKKSKLRNYFEENESNGIIACYKDNEITIKRIITEKLNGYKGLTTQVLNSIINNSGLDRNKVNNEIEKITTCFTNKIIDDQKIDHLLNIKTNDDYNKLKDEALNGNKNKTNRLLADTIFESENNVYYLNLINQRLNRLKDILNLKTNNTNIESIILNLKPPVFWKDKPILVKQLTKWNKEKIKIALKKTYEAELEMKSNSAIRKDIIIKNLIVELCASANAS